MPEKLNDQKELLGGIAVISSHKPLLDKVAKYSHTNAERAAACDQLIDLFGTDDLVGDTLFYNSVLKWGVKGKTHFPSVDRAAMVVSLGLNCSNGNRAQVFNPEPGDLWVKLDKFYPVRSDLFGLFWLKSLIFHMEDTIVLKKRWPIAIVHSYADGNGTLGTAKQLAERLIPEGVMYEFIHEDQLTNWLSQFTYAKLPKQRLFFG